MTINIKKDGVTVSSFKDHSGIKRWGVKAKVDSISFYKLTGHKGKMNIVFKDGSKCDCEFDDYINMLDFARRWRKAYGAKLFVGNEPVGLLSMGNNYLETTVV